MTRLTARRPVRSIVATGVALLVATAGLSASAAPPQPVLLAKTADPAVAKTDDGYVAMSTGRRVTMATAPNPSGPWEVQGGALPQRLPTWADGGSAWAPELHKVGTSWVLYFSVLADGMAENQRCIGAATASEPTGPFTYAKRPVVCPKNRARDRVPGRPVAKAGVIDPSVYEAPNGSLFLLYKTQQLPASLRIVALNGAGTAAKKGAKSRELVQSNESIIEHPLLVKRGKTFVLFASFRTFNTCRYQTIYMKARSVRSGAFQRAPQRAFLSSGNTGLCGPGGADVAPSAGGLRMFFHGWVCRGAKPCPASYNDNDKGATGVRWLYARGLKWKGSTPKLGAYVKPTP